MFICFYFSPNSVIILINNSLNYLSGKWSFLFHYFFQDFFLVLLIETNPSAFSFCLIFSESYPLQFEELSFCGSIHILTVCAQCLWWENWVWHEFGGCIGSYHLHRRWDWMLSGQKWSWCEVRLPLYLWPVIPYEGWC